MNINISGSGSYRDMAGRNQEFRNSFGFTHHSTLRHAALSLKGIGILSCFLRKFLKNFFRFRINGHVLSTYKE